MSYLIRQFGFEEKFFVAVQIMDVLSTLLAFTIGLEEANPILKLFFPHFGLVGGFLIGKLLTAAVLFWYSVNKNKLSRLYLVNRAFCCIVVWNLSLIAIKFFGV